MNILHFFALWLVLRTACTIAFGDKKPNNKFTAFIVRIICVVLFINVLDKKPE